MLRPRQALVIEGIQMYYMLDDWGIKMGTPSKKEVLFLPFMQIPTGHHHVADAVMEELYVAVKTISCEKVDILSYSYGVLEKLISTTYLNWIKAMPSAYDKLYSYLAVRNQTKRPRQLLYEIMFTPFFKRLINENKPNILFCTHCLPSNIASSLKQKGRLEAITVNVYTDYFVNRVWGIDGIDYHFVPSITVKDFLMDLGVKENKIFVTGIPVHPIFQEQKFNYNRKKELHILVGGGSLGIGSIEKIIPKNPTIQYTVLCGQNEKLYSKLQNQNNPYITPVRYIKSKKDMNQLYNDVDAVITKPGGVTISECLRKQLPIFTCNALPGQEKVNEMELESLGVINRLTPENVEQQIKDFFQNSDLQEAYVTNVRKYHNHIEKQPLVEILLKLCR